MRKIWLAATAVLVTGCSPTPEHMDTRAFLSGTCEVITIKGYTHGLFEGDHYLIQHDDGKQEYVVTAKIEDGNCYPSKPPQ